MRLSLQLPVGDLNRLGLRGRDLLSNKIDQNGPSLVWQCGSRTDREELLAQGWQALILGQGDTPEDVYENALREFCISRIDRDMLDF